MIVAGSSVFRHPEMSPAEVIKLLRSSVERYGNGKNVD
jgi:hypothetical protein